MSKPANWTKDTNGIEFFWNLHSCDTFTVDQDVDLKDVKQVAELEHVTLQQFEHKGNPRTFRILTDYVHFANQVRKDYLAQKLSLNDVLTAVRSTIHHHLHLQHRSAVWSAVFEKELDVCYELQREEHRQHAAEMAGSAKTEKCLLKMQCQFVVITVGKEADESFYFRKNPELRKELFDIYLDAFGDIKKEFLEALRSSLYWNIGMHTSIVLKPTHPEEYRKYKLNNLEKDLAGMLALLGYVEQANA